MDILDIVYLKNLISKIKTGNINIEKTADGGLNFYAQKDTADESKVSFTKDELIGVGIKSVVRDENNDIILTYTNNETKNLGKWNGENAKIEVVTDTDYNYTLKILYYDSNNQLTYFNTPNLIKKTELKENKNNTNYSYKIDIVNTDDLGVETVTTSPELMSEKYHIGTNSNNSEYVYKLDITKTNNEGVRTKTITPNLKAPVHEVKPNNKNNKYQFMMDIIKHNEEGSTTITTSNLRGNNIWEGIELVGDNIVFEVLADDDINYTRINDLYINTKTYDLYIRTDRNAVNNTWERIGNIRGIEGKDAYQVAVDDGFRGTRTEWLKSLMGESLGSQIVWEKPNIHDETTMLKVWYYYKVDTTKYGPGSAWLNRYDVPENKDYPPGKYAFYNGINYLCFETHEFTIPALSGKDIVSFYVLHDEKNSKCISHMINKETGEDTEQGDWIEVTTSSTLPEGAELVTQAGEIIQYGNWVQTIYLGNSKDSAYECTISTGADVSGFITSEEFKNTIGSDDLKTDRIDVKGSINEIFDMLKSSKDTILETTNKTLFEAVNELLRKKHIDCYKLEASDLLNHCLSDYYKTLTTNFIYCYNCTGVPESNNGYGYAMLVVSNDNFYRQIVFFDPSNGKISINNIGANETDSDFGSWSGWNSELTSNDITQTINTSSTATQVPSAKGIYDILSSSYVSSTVINDTDLNTVTDIGEYYTVNCTNKPINNDGYLKVYKCDDTHCLQEYSPITTPTKYIREQVKGSWTNWQKVCTTKVADVGKTDIKFNINNNYEVVNNNCRYFIKNGICTMILYVKCKTPANTWKMVSKVPKTSILNMCSIISSLNGDGFLRCSVNTTGDLSFVNGTAGTSYLGTITYPVSES